MCAAPGCWWNMVWAVLLLLGVTAQNCALRCKLSPNSLRTPLETQLLAAEKMSLWRGLVAIYGGIQNCGSLDESVCLLCQRIQLPTE